MVENTDVLDVNDDLMEDDPADSELIKKLRKQLKDQRAQAKAYEEEVVAFRTERIQARSQAVQDAVSGKEYPQAIVDALVTKAQEADEDEFQSILVELGSTSEEPVASKPTQEEPAAPSPSTLGQQVAAAASGGGVVDGIARLNSAKSEAEVNAIAKELGLDF